MKELFKNCVGVLEDDGWLIPSRFNERQREIIAHEVDDVRCHAPSSACLEFKTSASKLTFEYKITGQARPWAFFDLKCNGVLAKSVELSDNEGRVEISLDGGENAEYRLYLPHLAVIYLRNISSDLPLIPLNKRKKSWLAIGDSITQGMNAKHPSSSYPVIISDNLNLELLNTGVGGAKFNASHLDYIEKEPDIITVAFGCNDWGTSKEELIENVRTYFEKLTALYSCKNVYYILPIWRSDADFKKADMTFSEHRAVISDTVSEFSQVKIIDGYELLPHLLEYYGESKDPRVHPTDEGFEIMAQNIAKTIRKEIENL